MAKEKTDSFVKHDPTLWTLDADWQGTSFRRRMTVMKTLSGGLVIHSAIDLPDHQWQELEALGNVEAIIIPNYFHGSEASTYAEKFPTATVFVPSGLLKKIQRLYPEGRVLSAPSTARNCKQYLCRRELRGKNRHQKCS